MGSEKKPKGGGGYKWGSALIWAGGQFCVNWFITYEQHIWTTASACFSAFFAGWTTSVLLARFAKWGANLGIMMILGVIFGVVVFSGALSGLQSAPDWWKAKEVTVDWDKLLALLTGPSIVPPAALGLLTGVYVRMKFPQSSKK